ncbi:hypothetical protein Btru_031824, partial [Bulinus truncatus]
MRPSIQNLDFAINIFTPFLAELDVRSLPYIYHRLLDISVLRRSTGSTPLAEGKEWQEVRNNKLELFHPLSSAVSSPFVSCFIPCRQLFHPLSSAVSSPVASCFIPCRQLFHPMSSAVSSPVASYFIPCRQLFHHLSSAVSSHVV